MIRDLSVGVAYEPLRRLWPLLDAFGVAIIQEVPGADGQPRFEVATPADVMRAADELAKLIIDRAMAFARAHTTVDGLLRRLRDEEDPAWMPVRTRALCAAAMLAAAGRFEAARDALEDFGPRSDDSPIAQDERRTARQLGRWIDSAGDASLLPREPPPSRYAPRAVPSYSELRRHAALRDEAVGEITRMGREHDRDALRAALEKELARRGIEESPLWVEQTLDHLWDTSSDRARLGLHGVKVAGRLGLGIAKAVRQRELPAVSPPAWLAPPEHAAYTLPSSGRWVAVQLDPGASGWLQRTHEATPRLGATATSLHAWLARDPDAATPSPRVGVHLGERRVGVIPEDAAGAYLAALRDSEFRDELPNTAARLTRRDNAPHWLLEVSRPDQPGGANGRQ